MRPRVEFPAVDNVAEQFAVACSGSSVASNWAMASSTPRENDLALGVSCRPLDDQELAGSIEMVAGSPTVSQAPLLNSVSDVLVEDVPMLHETLNAAPTRIAPGGFQPQLVVRVATRLPASGGRARSARRRALGERSSGSMLPVRRMVIRICSR